MSVGLRVSRDGGLVAEDAVILLTAPVLRFAVHEDGAYEIVSPWFPRVGFTTDLLTRADGRRLMVRSDELTITCTNGGAVYALAAADALGVRAGRLLRSW